MFKLLIKHLSNPIVLFVCSFFVRVWCGVVLAVVGCGKERGGIGVGEEMGVVRRK
jgi:hypothetical protein